MIKNTLVSIEFEISEDYNKHYGQWDIFTDKLNDILDYYKSSIYKSGKIALNKRIGKSIRNPELTESDNKFLDEFKFNDFISKIKLATESYEDKLPKEQLYDQLIAVIIGECITLFKLSQVNECKNQDIKKVRLISDENYSCNECKVYSKFTYNVDNFDSDIIHPYCKLSIIPICNITTNIKTSIAEFIDAPIMFASIIKNITTKLTIQLKSFITPKKFIFTNDINHIQINDNEIQISNKLIDKLDIENLIVRELLKDKLIIKIDTNDWWNEHYNSKKSSRLIGDSCIIYSNYFINNEAQTNHTEYFIQCYIYHILHSSILKDIDIEAYDKMTEILCKEFIQG